MNKYFVIDEQIAVKYGVNEALMISCLKFWIEKNRANDSNYYDGRYWTYNSIKALTKLFPFWSTKQIRNILQRLRDEGVIIMGNYNNSQYDRTLWYAFADEKKWLSNFTEKDTSICPNNQLDFSCEAFPNAPEGKCIIKDNSNIPNNIHNNNNLHNKCVSNIPKKGKSYVLLGEFKNVKLTEEELKKVVENYQWYFEDAIDALSSYLEFKGDKYKSHYAVLGKTNWVWRKVHDNQDCGVRPVCNMIPDPTQVGGLRKETAWEYYSKKYGWDF